MHTETVGSADRTSFVSLSKVWLSLELTLVRLLFVKIFSTEFRENLTVLWLITGDSWTDLVCYVMAVLFLLHRYRV